ncbi:FxsA family protein [Chelativorans sp.]|uniref:FxsA family protein n=1 Tax=Chelativorans sp. TaxID=2203393 RepID=UPI002810CED7|nr:FxsA family protein [Chelativorans sp.]
MRFTIIPFLLLAIPLLEIVVFIWVGGYIGPFATLGLVLATAVAGSILLRIQGFAVLSRMRRDLEAHRLPGRELVHGVMILVAGLLLLTPGFVTDALGLLLFIPPLRDALWRFVRSRIIVLGRMQRRDRASPQGKTIDLDIGDYSTEDEKGSPWRAPIRRQD